MGKFIFTANQVDDMAFSMDIGGHKIVMDAGPEVGGKDMGVRPKPLLLAGLIGCTGMDVSSILKKMKVEYDSLDISVSADSTEDHPKVYENIHLVFHFKGENLPLDKLQRAAELSQEKYCGVSAMLKKATVVTYEVIVN